MAIVGFFLLTLATPLAAQIMPETTGMSSDAQSVKVGHRGLAAESDSGAGAVAGALASRSHVEANGYRIVAQMSSISFWRRATSL